VEMRELLRELGAMGKTIVLSSHILVELAELCDSIAIIEKGKVVTSGLLTEIRSRAQLAKRIRMRPLAPVEDARRALNGFAGVGVVDVPPLSATESEAGSTLEFDFAGDDEAAAGLLEYLISQKVRPVTFEEVHTGLEELFLQLTKGEVV
jgi:ABC-2 type transport system ATP-binding protein